MVDREGDEVKSGVCRQRREFSFRVDGVKLSVDVPKRSKGESKGTRGQRT